jgi:hypothetical protein
MPPPRPERCALQPPFESLTPIIRQNAAIGSLGAQWCHYRSCVVTKDSCNVAASGGKMTKLEPGTGAKIARYVAIWLAIELVPFIAIHSIYHKPIAVLILPFIAFGMPALAMVPIYGLWQLDARGASTRLLAWGWFWLMQGMISIVVVAMLIGGYSIHVLSRDEAIWGFAVMQIITAPIGFFAGYLKVLTTKSQQREQV